MALLQGTRGTKIINELNDERLQQWEVRRVSAQGGTIL